MAKSLTQEELAEALENCAREPVHIPGTVQPFACLLATDTNNQITYVSANTQDFLGHTPESLMGKHLRDVIGAEAWHALQNASAGANSDTTTKYMGPQTINGFSLQMTLSKSADHVVLEIEHCPRHDQNQTAALMELSYLIGRVHDCASSEILMKEAVNVLRHLTGYDRVIVYQFDRDFNGKVIAEAKQGAMEPYLGLQFPHWDIPPQAREIMKKLPLRLIEDSTQEPVEIKTLDGQTASLDLTSAVSRGVSLVHLSYLRNMGVRGSMTLSIVIEGYLWGMISFHHRKPRVLPAPTRHLLTVFLQVFTTKLLSLRNQTTLARVKELENDIDANFPEEKGVENALTELSPPILTGLGATGLAAISERRTECYGQTPDPEFLNALFDHTIESEQETLTFEDLANAFPAHQDQLNGCGGVLVTRLSTDRAICVFRPEIRKSISWAGKPDKDIQEIDGQMRLEPRGSFSVFLEEVQGRCESWSDDDIYLIKHIRILVNASERQFLSENLRRQQSLMIDELNHRVRNILTLVRSVSRQARRRYGSLDSYANAIENRIRALAASHNLGARSFLGPVSVKQLIAAEFEPYESADFRQSHISGADRFIKGEHAPIFSLVIHELTTNAAKYGSLSVQEGRVQVTLEETLTHALSLTWREFGGPPVNQVNETGFGTAMIEQAVPHELGGTTKLELLPSGVVAHFTLPPNLFAQPSEKDMEAQLWIPMHPEPHVMFSAKNLPGAVLLVEDNFIIAREMHDQLIDFGFDRVELTRNVEEALAVIQDEKPIFGVLDVNLGPNQTSDAIAHKLKQLEIPFIFVSGYGERASLPNEFSDIPKLTKPTTAEELSVAFNSIL